MWLEISKIFHDDLCYTCWGLCPFDWWHHCRYWPKLCSISLYCRWTFLAHFQNQMNFDQGAAFIIHQVQRQLSTIFTIYIWHCFHAFDIWRIWTSEYESLSHFLLPHFSHFWLPQKYRANSDFDQLGRDRLTGSRIIQIKGIGPLGPIKD